MFSIIYNPLIFIALSSPSTASEPRTELSPGIVFYTGDALRSSFLGGASLCYHYNRSLWFGADFMGGPVSVDRATGVNVRGDDKLYAFDGAIYWNMAALLDNAVGADFYTSVGLGHLWMGSVGEIFGFVGGGLTIHPGWKTLSVRFDLKNLFFVMQNSQGDDFNSDMALNLGPSWIF